MEAIHIVVTQMPVVALGLIVAALTLLAAFVLRQYLPSLTKSLCVVSTVLTGLSLVNGIQRYFSELYDGADSNSAVPLVLTMAFFLVLGVLIVASCVTVSKSTPSRSSKIRQTILIATLCGGLAGLIPNAMPSDTRVIEAINTSIFSPWLIGQEQYQNQSFKYQSTNATLRISGDIDNPTLERHIAGFERLNRLVYILEVIETTHLEQLPDLTSPLFANLREIQISKSSINDLSQLKQSPQVKSLIVERCKPNQLRVSGLGEIVANDTIQQLKVFNCWFTDETELAEAHDQLQISFIRNIQHVGRAQTAPVFTVKNGVLSIPSANNFRPLISYTSAPYDNLTALINGRHKVIKKVRLSKLRPKGFLSSIATSDSIRELRIEWIKQDELQQLHAFKHLSTLVLSGGESKREPIFPYLPTNIKILYLNAFNLGAESKLHGSTSPGFRVLSTASIAYINNKRYLMQDYACKPIADESCADNWFIALEHREAEPLLDAVDKLVIDPQWRNEKSIQNAIIADNKAREKKEQEKFNKKRQPAPVRQRARTTTL